MSTGIKIYYNIVNDTMYDSNGAMYGNSVLTAYFNNHLDLEVNYMTDTSSDSMQDWVPWTGLAGLSVSSSVSFDNDYIHASKGTSASATAGSTQFTVNVSVNEIDLNPSGVLVVYKTDGSMVSLPYTGFIYGASSTTFTLESGLAEDIPAGLKVRVPRSLFLKMQDEAVDNSQAHIGKFMFHTYLMSKKILETLDYSDSKSLTGTMEHKIVSDGNVVRTFTFPFTIANLLDYNGQASMPSTGDWASKDYVNSKIITPTIGAPNYGGAQDIAFSIAEGYTTYTTPSNGWLVVNVKIESAQALFAVQIDPGIQVFATKSWDCDIIPVASGTMCSFTWSGLSEDTDYISLKFVPTI